MQKKRRACEARRLKAKTNKQPASYGAFAFQSQPEIDALLVAELAFGRRP